MHVRANDGTVGDGKQAGEAMQFTESTIDRQQSGRIAREATEVDRLRGIHAAQTPTRSTDRAGLLIATCDSRRPEVGLSLRLPCWNFGPLGEQEKRPARCAATTSGFPTPVRRQTCPRRHSVPWKSRNRRRHLLVRLR